MTLHVHFESWYISLLSSAKQQREMTKIYVEKRQPQWLICLTLFGIERWRSVYVKPEQVLRPIDVLNRSTQLRHS